MVYGKFNQNVSVSLVYKRLQDSKQNFPMWDHALVLLRSCMVGIWINTETKPLDPHGEFYKVLPTKDQMWEQRRFEELLPNLITEAKTGLIL